MAYNWGYYDVHGEAEIISSFLNDLWQKRYVKEAELCSRKIIARFQRPVSIPSWKDLLHAITHRIYERFSWWATPDDYKRFKPYMGYLTKIITAVFDRV